MARISSYPSYCKNVLLIEINRLATSCVRNYTLISSRFTGLFHISLKRDLQRSSQKRLKCKFFIQRIIYGDKGNLTLPGNKLVKTNGLNLFSMKLLASVLLASASVMAIQRREGDMDHSNIGVDHSNMGMEHGDEHESEEPDPSALEEIEALIETTTPYEDHNVTVVHTTQSTIDHRTGYTIDIRTTAETTAPPEFTTPPETTAPPEECGEPVCGCNAEEMARWEHEMAEWKRDQERKLFVCRIST